jgi:hypothetical protein
VTPLVEHMRTKHAQKVAASKAASAAAKAAPPTEIRPSEGSTPRKAGKGRPADSKGPATKSVDKGSSTVTAKPKGVSAAGSRSATAGPIETGRSSQTPPSKPSAQKRPPRVRPGVDERPAQTQSDKALPQKVPPKQPSAKASVAVVAPAGDPTPAPAELGTRRRINPNRLLNAALSGTSKKRGTATPEDVRARTQLRRPFSLHGQA